MIKRTIFATLAAIGLMAAAMVPASAQTAAPTQHYGAYASGSIGLGFVQQYPNTTPFGLAIGYEFGKYARAELALDMYTMGQNGANLGSVSTFTGIPKVYLQYPFGKLSPYIDAGFGLASLNGSTNWNTAAVWTVGAGAKYQLTKNFALGVGYDYVTTTSQAIAGLGGSSSPWTANVVKMTGTFNF